MFLGLGHSIMQWHTCVLYLNSSWFATICSHFRAKGLFLSTKFSQLHVHLLSMFIDFQKIFPTYRFICLHAYSVPWSHDFVQHFLWFLKLQQGFAQRWFWGQEKSVYFEISDCGLLFMDIKKPCISEISAKGVGED